MLRAHLICHSHWDREWYLTRAEFLPKLVRLLDGLLDMVEQSPDYVSFMLDGQTIALEDYLQVRPYHRDRLKAAVQSGKIIIGPWYILPDEMLISGESHIRNYLTGRRAAAPFGDAMQIGYLPDSFGHPAQMPQILRGLGMDTAIFWRGTSNAMDKTEFYWQAPDKKTGVLCVHMAHGYGTAAGLGADITAAVKRLEAMTDTLGKKSTADVVLLMNGSDHVLAEKNIPEITAAFNRDATGKTLVFSTMKDFLADLNGQLSENLKTFSGNLCFGDRSLLLGGTSSTRVYLKQKNFLVQSTMERYLEPLICCEQLAGKSYDFAGYQNYLWKLILENHPHDSICGCSVDPLHDEMETRFETLEQLQRRLMLDTFERLQGDAPPQADAECLLLEPTQDGLPSYVEVDIDFDSTLQQWVNFSQSAIVRQEAVLPPPPQGIAVQDEQGRRIPAVLLSSAVCDDVMRHADYDLPRIYMANRVRVGLMLPGQDFGLHTLRFFKADAAGTPAALPGTCIENEFYTVAFDRIDGSFTVHDKKSGRTHTGVHKFVDMGDAGDEYTYSWPDHDRVCTLAPEDVTDVSVSVTPGFFSKLCVSGLMRLPRALSADRKHRADELVTCSFVITVTLSNAVDLIDFDTRIENNAEDHRLQVEFPVGTLCTHSSGSAAFTVTSHPIERAIPAHWEEYPLSTAVTHGFVDANDGTSGLSMASRGMMEYEAVNHSGQSHLRLTLLRCVGWLSRDDLNSRNGNGGWSLPTPGGQCKRTHDFSYSITYHQGTWQQAGTVSLADRRLHPVHIRQAVNAVPDLKNPLGLLSALPGHIRLSCVKPADQGPGIILRVYSLSDTTTALRLPLPTGITEAHCVSLREERIGALAVVDGRIEATVDPHGILTLELIPS